MKKIIFFALFFISSSLCFAQTYIAPVLGYEFVNMKQQLFGLGFDRIEFHNEGFATNPLGGLKIEQAIGKKFAITAQSLYSHRSFKTSFCPCASSGEEQLSYRNFQNNISLRYAPFSFLSLGMGYDFNITKDIKYSYLPNLITEIKDRGLSFSAGLAWRNLELTGFYHRGLNTDIFKVGQEYVSKNIAQTPSVPIDFASVTLSYKIKLFGANEGKKNQKPVRKVRKVVE